MHHEIKRCRSDRTDLWPCNSVLHILIIDSERLIYCIRRRIESSLYWKPPSDVSVLKHLSYHFNLCLHINVYLTTFNFDHSIWYSLISVQFIICRYLPFNLFNFLPATFSAYNLFIYFYSFHNTLLFLGCLHFHKMKLIAIIK